MKLGYLILAAGFALSFTAAVVPHFSGAHQMMFGVLVAHLVPYLVYAPAAFKLDDRAVQVAGSLLLMGHAALVIAMRFLHGGDYAGSMIVAVPLLAAVFLLPLLVRAAQTPWPEPEQQDTSASG